MVELRGGGAGRRVWHRELEPWTGEAEWPDLVHGLAELREELHVSRGRLHIALLPPLVSVRRIELPPLSARELRQVLTRDAARYFPGGGGARVVGAVRIPGARRSPAPVIAAAASAALVDALYAAAEAAGWRVAGIVAAESAWAAAAAAQQAALRKAAGDVVVPLEERTEVLRVRGGRLLALRRYPAGIAALSDPGESEGPAMPLCLLPESADASAPDTTPALLAACFAARSYGPELAPERVHAERARRVRRATAITWAATAALLVATAGLELWGVRRELDAVAAKRAEIRTAVGEASSTRELLLTLDARIATLAALDSTVPRWSHVVARVADALPGDAHLTALRGRADTLRLEGVASRAVGVFEALQRSAGVLGVRADAPIRREMRDGEPAVERFAIAARLAAGTPAAGTANADEAPRADGARR